MTSMLFVIAISFLEQLSHGEPFQSADMVDDTHCFNYTTLPLPLIVTALVKFSPLRWCLLWTGGESLHVFACLTLLCSTDMLHSDD